MSKISDKAYVDKNAKIGKHVTIYPFAYIEGDVEIGDECTIFPYASVMNGTRMGALNHVFQGTVLGARPQDFNYNGDKTELIIGDENIFRENVVINRATFATGQTVIGKRNFFMEGAHVSHDTKIADYCTFGYGTKIAGDCDIASGVICSSNVLINAGVRVGVASMITGGVRVSKDVPPFIVATDNPVKYGGVNESLLRQSHMDEKIIGHIANAYRLVFHGQTSVFDACIQVKQQVPDSDAIRTIVEFIENTKLGIISKI